MADKVSPMQDDIARPPSPRNDTFDDENINEKTGVGRETSPKTSRHCGLQARHITMIAIGGKALAQAGPSSIFVSYTIVGFIVYLLMSAVGEMAAWLPMSSSFSGYAARFCDPALGFALGWCYWFKYIIVCPNQLTAGALVLQYWVDRDKVSPGVFIAVFFGHHHIHQLLWNSLLWRNRVLAVLMKVFTIIGTILFSLVITCGGGPRVEAIGFKYWHNPGAFKEYIDTGSAGQFLGFWSCMVTAVFAFLGTELVGVTVAEA
ncbi:hypothetical protein V2G26_002764 [Clonostachys chloroleuca]